MNKYHSVLHDAVTRPKRSRAPAALALALAVLVAPILYESGLLVLAGWSTMTGAYSDPKTPVLSALSGWSQAAGGEARARATRALSGPWDSSLAVPVAVTWAAVIAVVFLRRCR